jgi:hypothetical protein
MTYVASPSSAPGDPSRADNLRECLQSAREHLDETSKASDTERESELINSAVDAGWEEGEVPAAIAEDTNSSGNANAGQTAPSFGIVPSSSM